MLPSIAVLASCAVLGVTAAPAPFPIAAPAPKPLPAHAVGSHLLSLFDDADLVAISDRLARRDSGGNAAVATLESRHAAAGSGKSLKFSLSKKRHEWGRSTKRFTRRQANASVDDESELLNFQDIR